MSNEANGALKCIQGLNQKTARHVEFIDANEAGNLCNVKLKGIAASRRNKPKNHLHF